MKVEYNPAGAQDIARPKKRTGKGRDGNEDSLQAAKSPTDAYTLDIKSSVATEAISTSIETQSQATQSANDLKGAMLKNPSLSYNSMNFDSARVSALLGSIASEQSA
jgi:hypothetical protein